MAGVDTTIEWKIRNYPSLFANRTQGLHHLFCVLGNGWDWEGGELLPWGGFYERTDDEVLCPAPEYLRELPEEVAASILADLAPRNARLHDIRSRAAELARTPGLITGASAYPVRILKELPADIRPDWAAAAQELRDYAAQHGEVHPDPPKVDV